MYKKIKRIAIVVGIVSIIVEMIGVLFVLDKVGKIDLKNFGIQTDTSGYVDGDIVANMKIVHDYIREHDFDYGGLGALNESTEDTFLSHGQIDCSSYVSYVLWVSGIKVGNHWSWWYKDKEFEKEEYSEYNWQIVPWSQLMPGDILVRGGHVEFYREGSTTYCAGGKGCITSDHSDYRKVERIIDCFNFALRVTK